jgi:hypothetical protein
VKVGTADESQVNVNTKINFFFCLTKFHALKGCGGERVWRFVLFIATPDGGER